MGELNSQPCWRLQLVKRGATVTRGIWQPVSSALPGCMALAPLASGGAVLVGMVEAWCNR